MDKLLDEVISNEEFKKYTKNIDKDLNERRNELVKPQRLSKGFKRVHKLWFEIDAKFRDII